MVFPPTFVRAAAILACDHATTTTQIAHFVHFQNTILNSATFRSSQTLIRDDTRTDIENCSMCLVRLGIQGNTVDASLSQYILSCKAAFKTDSENHSHAM